MITLANLCLKALAILCLCKLISASPGDQLQDFRDCLHQCHQLSCYKNPYYLMQEQYSEALQKKNFDFRRYEPNWHFQTELSRYLKLLIWDCKSNCDYQCQRIITKERKETGEEVYQFHGKWPFLRVFGVQEFFSALFSLANFVPHYLGYRKVNHLQRSNPREKTILKSAFRNIKLVAIITMCAWACSTIFHIRDFIITERLDYYFAGLTVLTGFYAIGFRYLRLYLPSRKLYAWMWAVFCTSAYFGHVYRLFNDWSYTYNMRANIFVGVLQNLVWGLVCFSLYTQFYEREKSEEDAINLTHINYIHPKRVILGTFFTKSAKLYSLYPLMLCGIVILGMSLEIFDFPPIFGDLIDAHSLWHLVTVFPALYGWYDWMLWDINENIWDDYNVTQNKKNQ